MLKTVKEVIKARWTLRERESNVCRYVSLSTVSEHICKKLGVHNLCKSFIMVNVAEQETQSFRTVGTLGAE